MYKNKSMSYIRLKTVKMEIVNRYSTTIMKVQNAS